MSRDDQLVVDTVELRRHTGTRRDLRAAVAIGDLAVGDAAVVGELDIDLVVEAVTEGVVASGAVRGGWTAPCRRCLEPIEEAFEVELHEIFEAHPTEGETWPLGEDGIDLRPVVTEAALLALPLAPLCREDCAGPAPERFPTEVVTEEPSEPAADPRWAALDELTFEERTFEERTFEERTFEE